MLDGLCDVDDEEITEEEIEGKFVLDGLCDVDDEEIAEEELGRR